MQVILNFDVTLCFLGILYELECVKKCLLCQLDTGECEGEGCAGELKKSAESVKISYDDRKNVESGYDTVDKK